MYNDVLVLNKFYIPIHIVSYQEALSRLFSSKAKALDNNFCTYSFNEWVTFSSKIDSDCFNKIKTINYKIAIPEVIVLNNCTKLNNKYVKYSKQNVYERDNYTCQYCGKKYNKSYLTKDHVIPKSAGGLETWSNIVTCCKYCNVIKANKSLNEINMTLINKPTNPKWISPNHKIRKGNSCKSWMFFEKRFDG